MNLREILFSWNGDVSTIFKLQRRAGVSYKRTYRNTGWTGHPSRHKFQKRAIEQKILGPQIIKIDFLNLFLLSKLCTRSLHVWNDSKGIPVSWHACSFSYETNSSKWGPGASLAGWLPQVWDCYPSSAAESWWSLWRKTVC